MGGGGPSLTRYGHGGWSPDALAGSLSQRTSSRFDEACRILSLDWVEGLLR